MADERFDRVAGPDAGERRRRADGRAVLFSDEPLSAASGPAPAAGQEASDGAPSRGRAAPVAGPRPGPRGLRLCCPRCEAFTAVSPLAVLAAAVPLPFPRLALTPGRADILSRCPACGERNWLQVGW